ncbi:MAG: ABC transporter ATP-binding protein [Candidatus Omnitrophica bacterium]|nr:ABC transporter ATP-binding protein [Candidatus Omnitrophota bacterium]
MESLIIKIKKSVKEVGLSLKLLGKFKKYIFRYWKQQLLMFVLSIIFVIFELINPYLLGREVLDKGILSKNTKAFLMFSLIGALIYIVNMVLSSIHRYVKNYIIRRIHLDLSKDVLKCVNEFSLATLQDRATGEHLFRSTQDVSAVSNVINDVLHNLFLSVFKIILIASIIIFIKWEIVAFMFAYQIAVVILINPYIKKIQNLIVLNSEKSEDLFKRLVEIFSHLYIIKSFGTMSKELKRYFRELISRTRVEIDETKSKITFDFLQTITNKLFFASVGFFGLFLVIKDKMTLGILGVIMIYISKGLESFTELVTSFNQVIINRVSLERVEEIFDTKIELKEPHDAKTLLIEKGKAEFRNVTFGYKKDYYVFKHANFFIMPSTHIALAGASGCGKTTILNLILRLYDVNDGAVLLDNHDVKSLKRRSLYDQISIASQNPLLWDSTIFANIAYRKKNMKMEELIEAAKLAEAHDFIMELPQQYYTIIGEMACKISEGQKQRLSLARAILGNPKILLLDEAMSSLDSATEDKIIDNIRNRFVKSTVILVSHRVSSIKKMDLVYFIEGPNKIEIDTHSKLIEKSPKYRSLFASQLGV